AEAAAAAEAAAEAAAAAEPGFMRMVAAAQEAKDKGGNWWAMRSAAYRVANELRAERGWVVLNLESWRQERDQSDREFIAMVLGMAALTEADVAA
ncbi:MAG TPA: hypothetical protein VKU41_20205, partial [Polyangiaceae bacterium]|nr:hypothetical protein [Polyangiaceae bacterium]